MAGYGHVAAAFPRPVVGYGTDIESTGQAQAGQQQRQQRNQAPRIHPALYAFALLSAAILCMLSIAALEGYGPPAHLPGRHDGLFSHHKPDDRHHEQSGHSQLDIDPQEGQIEGKPKRVSASWNNIASVIGGFSTTYIASPQLNTSWIARPAGFGARIEGEALVGKLGYLHLPADGNHNEGFKESSSIGRTGCNLFPGAPLPLKDGMPRIALIERGECQFLTKLLNAQAQGFDAAIIYNDYEHFKQKRSAREDRGFDRHSGEDELISMWSPSREAALLHIPSVFVAHLTGKTLETLVAVEGDSHNEAIVIMEPEETPHFLLMDIIIALFFLPTIFTSVVLIVTRLRQIRHRAQQRAPQTLVDSLPTFQWSEGLDLNIDALARGEKAADEENASAISDLEAGRAAKSAGMDHKLAAMLSKVLRRPAPAGDGVSARHTVIPARKARHLAKKIFQQRECAICLSDFTTGETVRLLPCGHLYHKDEIDSWLTEQKRWCPVCRYSVDGSDEEEAPAAAEADEDGAQTAMPSPNAIAATAQPIIRPDDIEGYFVEDSQPVASSSTASERTPLLPTLSRSSDKY